MGIKRFEQWGVHDKPKVERGDKKSAFVLEERESGDADEEQKKAGETQKIEITPELRERLDAAWAEYQREQMEMRGNMESLELATAGIVGDVSREEKIEVGKLDSIFKRLAIIAGSTLVVVGNINLIMGTRGSLFTLSIGAGCFAVATAYEGYRSFGRYLFDSSSPAEQRKALASMDPERKKFLGLLVKNEDEEDNENEENEAVEHS